MTHVTFITGNQSKAEYLERYLGLSVRHQKVELDEIQSLDLREIVRHKALQAYQYVQGPVLVEDVALEFRALGRLPGPFIKFFLEEMSEDSICKLVDTEGDRRATARCVFGYYNGKHVELFEGSLDGLVAQNPAGNNGYGWDRIFIPDSYTVTRAELNETDNKRTYLQIKPLEQVRDFLKSHKDLQKQELD